MSKEARLLPFFPITLHTPSTNVALEQLLTASHNSCILSPTSPSLIKTRHIGLYCVQSIECLESVKKDNITCLMYSHRLGYDESKINSDDYW
ncbi:hypothetical protein BGZ63DRAFT_41200 [Mariannaea sp. PMI_226]|nr:hypothetical protein BGZ63DRAFT_41200 [Mariannaea sp. PMI_226]